MTDDEFGGFRVTIPAREGGRCAYGCGAGAAGAMMAFMLLIAVGSPKENTLSALVFACLLGVVVLFLGYACLYAWTGREVLIIDGKTLTLRHEFAGSASDRLFELAEITNLRPRRTDDPTYYHAVVFEYGGQIHGFGAGLTEHEVLRLVKTIRSRYAIRDKDDWSDAEPLPVIT